MSKAYPSCNCKRHRSVCLKNSTAKAVGKCSCSSEHFEYVELVYSRKAEDFVCANCKHYPVWVKPAAEAETVSEPEFSQDLRAILATWNLEPDDEFSAGEEWLVNLVNKGA